MPSKPPNQGATVGQVFEANRVFNVAAILDPAIRQVPEEIGSLLLANNDGVRIKLAGRSRCLPEEWAVQHFARGHAGRDGRRRRDRLSLTDL